MFLPYSHSLQEHSQQVYYLWAFFTHYMEWVGGTGNRGGNDDSNSQAGPCQLKDGWKAFQLNSADKFLDADDGSGPA